MTGSILWLFLAVPLVGLQCIIVVFPGHTHLFFSPSIHSMTLSLVLQYFFYFCKGDIETEDLGSFQYLQSKSSQSGSF